MRIGFNTLFLIPGKVGGTETYARGIISGLQKVDRDNNYLIFCNKENYPTFEFKPGNFQRLLIPISATTRPLRILWEQVALPFQALANRIDVLISLGYVCPLFVSCKSVVVIFDLNWFFHPEEFSFLSRVFWKYLVTWSAKRADLIITSSENSKKDIVRILQIPQEKIRVVYGGIDRDFFSDKGDDKEVGLIKKKYGLGERFILTVSAAYKFKNLSRLIEAFRLLAKETKDLKLLIVGLGGRGGVEMRDKIKQYGLVDRVIVAGWVSNEDLPKLYRAAEGYIHPSLYEGFGFPVLEAMSCGCPVVSSKAASLPELVEGAGLLVNAECVEEMAEALGKIRDQSLGKRLIASGLERCRRFGWRDAAVRINKILKEFE